MKNNGMSIVEKHNELLVQIRKADSADDMRQLFVDVKEFVTLYGEVDADTVNRVYEKYAEKLQEMLTENDAVYNRLSEKAETITNSRYDFKDEKDDTLAVQSKVLQLMARLPKEKTVANAGSVSNVIEQEIKSGVGGCKAVLELMKYPVHVDMITESQKQKAYAGSKSEAQQAFERMKETELRKVEKVCAEVFLKGFHLRKIEKLVKSFRKSSVWA